MILFFFFVFLATRRRAHFCKFCFKKIKNFGRHLSHKHKDEDAVKEYLSSGGRKKYDLFCRIAGEGDALYNLQHPKDLITARSGGKIEDKVACPYCQMSITLQSFNKHVEVHEERTEKKGTMKAKAILKKINVPQELSLYIKNEILPTIKKHYTRYLLTNDLIFIEHANQLADKYLGEGQAKLIATHLRTISNLFIKINACRTKEDKREVQKTHDFFTVENYKYFICSMKEIGGAGEGPQGEYLNPTTIDQYGRIFFSYSDTVFYWLTLNQEDTDEVMKWQKLYKTFFNKKLSANARKQAGRRTLIKRQAVPSTQDVQSLINYIKNQFESSYTDLERNGFSIEHYKILMETLLLKLWIFNRKRVKEVDQIELADWNSRSELKESDDQYKALSTTEKMFADSFSRICVKGKGGRIVALLVSKKDLKYFDIMLKWRAKSGVHPNNKYLFAVGKKYLEGTKVMRQYSIKCGAEHPELLRGTKLRKNLAVGLQYISLSSEDLRLVAETLGHRLETHLQFYRHPVPALHLGRVSKLLTALDSGKLEEFRGRSLDDIEIEEAPEEDRGSLLPHEMAEPIAGMCYCKTNILIIFSSIFTT